MASVDGSRYLHGASDEIYDVICVPCKNDGTEKQAEHYCQNCKEYLCSLCKDYHKKVTVTRNHKILSGSMLPKLAKVDKGPNCGVFCSCSQNREVTMYCEDHEEVLCHSCESVKHRKCKTISLEEKSQNYTSTTYTILLENTKSLRNNIDAFKQKRTEDGKELDDVTENCKGEIKKLRKKLNNDLDKLEAETLNELDRYKDEHLQYIQKHVLTLETAYQMLDSDVKTLEDGRISGQKTTMFALDTKVSKGLKEYKTLLEDTKKDFTRPQLSFIRNLTLADIEKQMGLGFLKRYDKKMMADLDVQSSRQVTVKSHDDTDCGVYGCVFLPGGHILVLIAASKNRIQLLDDKWTVQEELHISSLPFSAALVSSNEVLVSFPEKQQLRLIKVLPKIKSGRKIQLDKECAAVAVCGDEIYTTCSSEEGEGEVRVLDLHGNLKRRIGLNHDGSYMFKTPYCVAVNPTSRKIFVSDAESATITCLTMDGDFICQYKDKDLKSPTGMIVDANNDVVVCDMECDNVQIITTEGNRQATLVSASDGLKRPCSIAFRESDGTLIIGCEDQGIVFVFKLA